MIKMNWKINRFAELQRKLPNIARMIVETQTDAAVSLMKQLAPVDTGYMKESIHKVEETNFGGATASKGIKIDAPYWVYVEYGTVHMSAQPFVTPALESVRSSFVMEAERIIKRELS